MTDNKYAKKIKDIGNDCKIKLINVLNCMPNNTYTFHNENDVDGIVYDDDNQGFHRIKIYEMKLKENGQFVVTDELTLTEYKIEDVFSFSNQPFAIDLYDGIRCEMYWLQAAFDEVY